MNSEKGSNTALSCRSFRDRLLVHPHAFGGELLEAEHAFDVKNADNHALPPVDPHHFSDRPFLNVGKEDGQEVAEYHRPKRGVGKAESGRIGLIFHPDQFIRINREKRKKTNWLYVKIAIRTLDEYNKSLTENGGERKWEHYQLEVEMSMTLV